MNDAAFLTYGRSTTLSGGDAVINGLDLRAEAGGDVTKWSWRRSAPGWGRGYFERYAGEVRLGARDQGTLGLCTRGAAERLSWNARHGAGRDRVAALRSKIVAGPIVPIGRDVFFVVRL